jgi:hypothetical protein
MLVGHHVGHIHELDACSIPGFHFWYIFWSSIRWMFLVCSIKFWYVGHPGVGGLKDAASNLGLSRHYLRMIRAYRQVL